MGLFSRRKADRAELDEEFVDDERDGLTDDADDVAEPEDAVVAADGTNGPFDRSVIEDDTDYLKLGSIWLKGQPGMELRLEVNQEEQAITGVTAALGESTVQLQAFAAPRTEGVWIDIRNEIAESITSSGGTAEVVSGDFGQELLTRMPQTGPDGRTVFAPALFIGVDGPRWFLRAVLGGRAAVEPEASVALREVIRTVVIDRDGEARPPRELLPLALPEEAVQPAPETEDEVVDAAPALDDLKPFERGPEITEVR